MLKTNKVRFIVQIFCYCNIKLNRHTKNRGSEKENATMNHKFKNERVRRILWESEKYDRRVGNASMQKAAAYMAKLSTEEMGNVILGGFYSSLVEVAG